MQECVDHVRWEAARVAPGRVLVVTYQANRGCLQQHPGGICRSLQGDRWLDVFKDVALLIVIGRPLPASDELAKLTSTYLGHVPMGDYLAVQRGVLMHDGTRRAIS